jgi:hypothetical protein
MNIIEAAEFLILTKHYKGVLVDPAGNRHIINHRLAGNPLVSWVGDAHKSPMYLDDILSDRWEVVDEEVKA